MRISYTKISLSVILMDTPSDHSVVVIRKQSDIVRAFQIRIHFLRFLTRFEGSDERGNHVLVDILQVLEDGIITSCAELVHAIPVCFEDVSSTCKLNGFEHLRSNTHVHNTRKRLHDKTGMKRKTSQTTRTAPGRLTAGITNIIVRGSTEKRNPCLFKDQRP